MQDWTFVVAENGDLSPVIQGGETSTNTESGGGAATTATETTTQDTTAEAPKQDNGWSIISMVLLWGAIIAVFWFFSIRPQRKKEKQLQQMQSAIKTGDDVVTSSGFFGRVVEVGTDQFTVEFGTNRGIRIPVRKSDVMLARKTEPADTKAIEDKKDGKKDDKELKDSDTKS